jgi:DNA topoisomerase-1
VAKGGKQVRRRITDSQLVRTVRRCHELPGQALFAYPDESGRPRPITSGEVNAYLREIAGGAFSAKDFRTWAASVLAFERTAELLLEREAEARKKKIPLKAVVEPVAEDLANTPAICKKSYIHPEILKPLKNGGPKYDDFCAWPCATRYMSAGERAFLKFLEKKRPTPSSPSRPPSSRRRTV